MRLFLNALSFLFIILVFWVVYLIQVAPKIPIDQDLKITPTPEYIARGKYLVNHIAACMNCHGTRDWGRFSAPVISGTEGKGGQTFTSHNLSFFGVEIKGKWIAQNITPFNMGFWIDGEIYRALTSGVNLAGKSLHPAMPYSSYRDLMEEDVFAIIAYIKSLPQIISPKYKAKTDFQTRLALKAFPKKYTPPPPIDYSNKVQRGEYLVTIANCFDCHTPSKKASKPFKLSKKITAVGEGVGGVPFPLKTGGTVYSANITPDSNTGIGNWSEDRFIQTFKNYNNKKLNIVVFNTSNTVMPWSLYKGMSNSDLGAIYQYLMTLKPVSNEFKTFIPEAL